MLVSAPDANIALSCKISDNPSLVIGNYYIFSFTLLSPSVSRKLYNIIAVQVLEYTVTDPIGNQFTLFLIEFLQCHYSHTATCFSSVSLTMSMEKAPSKIYNKHATIDESSHINMYKHVTTFKLVTCINKLITAIYQMKWQ